MVVGDRESVRDIGVGYSLEVEVVLDGRSSHQVEHHIDLVRAVNVAYSCEAPSRLGSEVSQYVGPKWSEHSTYISSAMDDSSLELAAVKLLDRSLQVCASLEFNKAGLVSSGSCRLGCHVYPLPSLRPVSEYTTSS